MCRILALALTCVLAGCSSSSAVLTRPEGGYPALRVIQTVQVPHVLNMSTLILSPGTVLVGERRMPDGETIYCGDVAIDDVVFGLSPRKMYLCFAKRGDDLVVNADRSALSKIAPIPPGSLVETRI